MRRFPTALIIAVLAVVFVITGFRLFWKTEQQRAIAVNTVLHQRSLIHITETVIHAKGPIAREQWDLVNTDGKSTASYSAMSRDGTRVAKFPYRITGFDVTFTFEALVRDGIWELKTRPLRGKQTDDVYQIRIAQTDGNRSGSHQFEFADPHYLATGAGREYDIHLDRNKPVPDILTLQSTSTADDRYQKIVNDFNAFGPPGFHTTVIAARKKLLAQ
jgi:hypothetical protein